MKFCKQFVLTICIAAWSQMAYSQVSIVDSSIKIVLVSVNYGAYWPGGDLDNRFGFSNVIGLSSTIKTASNWLLGIEGGYLFGSVVKETGLFRNISTPDGGIIGSDGRYADIKTYERGFLIVMNAGKLFPVKKPNRNSGFLLMAGAGFIQHKIRIEVSGNTVPYLDKEYRKGYDRLSNGLALHQFAGYQYLSNKGLVNFYAGVDLYEAFTQNRRDYNFDEKMNDDSNYTDLLIGFRAGWILPLYKKAADQYYMY